MIKESFLRLFTDAAYVVRRNATRYWTHDPHGTMDARCGWRKMFDTHELHPSVKAALEVCRPKDWQHLLFEWPHVSIEDTTKLAYTPDDRSHISDRQVRTSVGKYLRRHWPHLADHHIRDLVAAYTPDKCEIITTREGIVQAIEFGPRSCMQSAYGAIPFRESDFHTLQAFLKGEIDHGDVPWEKHPYWVYAPKLGWAVAVRYSNNQTDSLKYAARALVNTEGKVFVRSYSTGGNDCVLEQWLSAQGYKHVSGWEGCSIAYVEGRYSDEPRLPYIDGDVHTAVRDGGVFNLRDRSDAEEMAEEGEEVWECRNTNGTGDRINGRDRIGECDDCGADVHEDDDERLWAGRNEDRLICPCCADNYREVRSTSGYWWEHEDETREVVNSSGRTRYHVSSWDLDRGRTEQTIVYLDYDEVYAEEDDCVYIERSSEYRFSDDSDVCYTAEEEYELKEDCWEDAHGDWHHDDVEFVEYEGEKYLQDDCWQCTGTGLWYPPCVEHEYDEDGNPVHPDYLEQLEQTQRVNIDAEEVA
jgi:hypothetical protein